MQTTTESQEHNPNERTNRWKLANAQDTLDRARNQAITLIQAATTNATRSHLEACARAIDQSITDAQVMIECAKHDDQQAHRAD